MKKKVVKKVPVKTSKKSIYVRKNHDGAVTIYVTDAKKVKLVPTAYELQDDKGKGIASTTRLCSVASKAVPAFARLKVGEIVALKPLEIGESLGVDDLRGDEDDY